MLWKNGQATALTDGTHGAYARSVAVSGSDVYVAGVESDGKTDVVKIWNNGAATALTDGTLEGVAGQIAVSGTDLYVAGGQFGFDAQNQYRSIAGYWKNGVFTTLLQADSQGQNGGTVGPLVVQGTDVYVAGAQNKTTSTGPNTAVADPAAMYWKNDQPVVLTDGLTLAEANSMTVVGSDVYVAGGLCDAQVPDCLYATYWKNGVATKVSTANSILSGIAIAGTNVYTSGQQSAANSSLLWTNDTPTLLDKTSSGAANGVVAFGSDVYVVGAQIGGACYWKNGTLQPVTTGQYQSDGYGIAVVQPDAKVN